MIVRNMCDECRTTETVGCYGEGPGAGEIDRRRAAAVLERPVGEWSVGEDSLVIVDRHALCAVDRKQALVVVVGARFVAEDVVAACQLAELCVVVTLRGE